MYKKTGDIEFQQKEGEEEIETEKTEEVFVGVFYMMTPVGPREVKFQMPEAISIEDAFSKYEESAQKIAKMHEEKIEEMKKDVALKNKIITASPDVLARIDKGIVLK